MDVDGSAPDHYAILGVARDATLEQISAAYRARARELHPDLNQLQPERAGEQMRAVNDAWSTLRDADRRTAYDRTIAASLDLDGDDDIDRGPEWDPPPPLLPREVRQLRRLVAVTIVILVSVIVVFTIIAFAQSG